MMADVDKPAARRQIGSVRVGFRLIRTLEATGRPMSVTELAKAGGMPASQAHLYLASFAQEGLVWQDPSTSCYQLGPYAIQLGVAAIKSTDPLSFTKDALIRLAQETGESAYASIWTEHGPVIVQKIDGERLTPVSIRIGHVMPLLTSATGRVFLAFMPPSQTRALVQKELALLRERADAAMHEWSIDRVAVLVQTIRTVGMAQTDNLLYSGFFGVSAPILDHDDGIRCSITLLGPRGTFDGALDGSAAKALRTVANAVSLRLGKSAPGRRWGQSTLAG
jgi:DNA-binding IclR family transcriptional regulator